MTNREIDHASNGGRKDVKARLHKPCRDWIQEHEALDDVLIILQTSSTDKGENCQVLQLEQQYQNKKY